VMEHGEEKKALASPQDVAAVIDKLPRAVLRRLQPKLRKLGFDITFEKGGHRKVKLHKDLTTVRGDEEMLYNMLVKEEGLSSDVSLALVKEFSEKNASITEEISALTKRLDKQAAKKLKVQRAARGGEAAAAYRVAPVAAYAGLFTMQRSLDDQERGAREVVSERKALKSLRANNNNSVNAAAAEEKTDSAVSNVTVREVLLQQTSYRPERDGRFVKKADRDQREAKLMSPRQGSGSFKKRSGAGRKVVILGAPNP